MFIHKPKSGKPKLYWTDPGAAGSRQQYRFFIHHGAGAANTPAGKLNRLIQFMEYFDADIFFMGHVHDQKGQRLVQVAADSTCTKLVEREKIGMVSGSYLKTYDQGTTTYGEKRGYRPVKLGAVSVSIKPYHREVRAAV